MPKMMRFNQAVKPRDMGKASTSCSHIMLHKDEYSYWNMMHAVSPLVPTQKYYDLENLHAPVPSTYLARARDPGKTSNACV